MVSDPEGTRFRFLINDQKVAEGADNTLARGEVGLAVELYDPGDQAVFEFDNLVMRER